ncbi:MAG: phosphotransacetylase family protein [Actinobacteria bacterium]|nr:phosphotransacetylase family protein [Actinomycetota bacterium]
MRPLLFSSNKSFSGKSSMCAGIGRLLLDRGYKTGYLKPLCTLPEKLGTCYIDEDVRYIIDILSLKDKPEDICPMIFTEQTYDKALDEYIKASPPAYFDKIKKAYEAISKDKDFVLIESARNITYGSFARISAKDICAATNAKTVLVMKYEEDIVDKAAHFVRHFDEYFGGIIINLVALDDRERIENLILPYFKKEGILIFGVVYTDKVLSSISIKDMSKYLDGEVLCAEEHIDELVESFMVGAMGHEMALRFFRSKSEKVVITGGDRADIQLAALETNTKCLVLTGNFQPSTIVISRAEELGVPMILVSYDTLTTVGKLNEILGRSNLHELKKLDKILQITRDNIDIDKIISIAK